MPRIAVLSTGGTIASLEDPATGGAVPALTAEQLVIGTRGLRDLADITAEQIVNIDSSQMTPDIWRHLLTRVNAWLAEPDVAGVVIPHGTDTLEETAYFLDLTVAGSKPVILVGAQVSATYPDSDGPRNLYDAVRVALSPEAAGKGAMVVMNGQINAAREVTKTNSIEREAFQSLEFGALGIADVCDVRFYRAPLRRQSILYNPSTPLPRIEIVMHYAGADGRVLDAMLANWDRYGCDGIVISATGVGNVSETMYTAIARLRQLGVPVFISSRVYTGRVLPLYGAKGSGVSLKQLGCILADNLSPQKSRVLAMLALTRTRDERDLQAIFAR
jgi:L-asparaginase